MMSATTTRVRRRNKNALLCSLFAVLFASATLPAFVDASDDGDEVCISNDGKTCCPDSTNTLKNEGTLYCGKPEMSLSNDGRGITKTRADGSTNTVWWQNLYPCKTNALGECHWDDDSDDDDDDDDDDGLDDEDEEGEDVCRGVNGKCCIDTVTTGTVKGSDGNLYCSRYPIVESEKGITKTYPSGKKNTVWWMNIDTCEENSRGMCHYDESEDGQLMSVNLPSESASKGSMGGGCYPLDGGYTTCHNPMNPVEATCTLPDGKQKPGCCPTSGSSKTVVPGMTCSVSASKGNNYKLCYPNDDGHSCSWDPTTPVEATCSVGGSKFPGCCPQGVTSGYIPGMTCVLGEVTSPNVSVPAPAPVPATTINVNLDDEEGDDVCIGAQGGCCIDTVTTGMLKGGDGNTYCSRYPIVESSDGRGIRKTYPSGKKNTVWWINIYPCQQNSRGMCHYDESEDGPLMSVNLPSGSASKGSMGGGCYPLDGGYTTCHNPMNPVKATCTLPDGKQKPGCCPTSGSSKTVVPGMTCSVSASKGNNYKLCYPNDDGHTCAFDPTTPVEATCDYAGNKFPGCCPQGVTSGYIPGMTCVLGEDTSDAVSVPAPAPLPAPVPAPVPASNSNLDMAAIANLNSDDEGSDVCIGVDKGCCIDSVATGVLTGSDGTIYCSKYPIVESSDGRGITKTYPSGKTNTVWFTNIYSCQENSIGMCHYDEDDYINSADEDEEGDDVCMGTNGKCCADTVGKGSLTGSDGNLYCSRYPIVESESGITKTKPDGKTNTKYWKNINLCVENSKGMCHYDESLDGPFMLVDLSSESASKGSKGPPGCYPLDGGYTTCHNPMNPVKATCTLPDGKQKPGCCPTSGSSKTVVPGMTCSISASKSDNDYAKCYPNDDGHTCAFDPTTPVEATCNFKGSEFPGCCPEGVTSGYILGMTCILEDDTADAPKPEGNYENCEKDGSMNIKSIACDNAEFSVMCDALNAIDTENLSSSGLYTAFFPTDEAFAALDGVLSSLTDEQVKNIFQFHFHEGAAIAYYDLGCKETIVMSNGYESRTKCIGSNKYQKGQGNYEEDSLPMIVMEGSNIEACNGIVHAIDHVMLPKHWNMSDLPAIMKTLP